MIPVMEEYKYHEGEYLKRIMKRLEYDLVAILPDLDKRNDIDKAIRVRKLGDYHFPIKNQKLYEWEYKNKMKVPKPPNEEKPGIKEHVEEAVDEELGEVYHLIRSLKRQIQTDELQRQARARLVNQARREEQRARDVRGETFQNSQFNGRRKRNVSDDIVETKTTKSTTSAKTSIVVRSTVTTTPTTLTTTTTPTILTTTTTPTTPTTPTTTTTPTTLAMGKTTTIPRTTRRTTATSEMPSTTTFGISTLDSNQQVSNFTMAVKLKQLPTSSTMTTPQQTTEFTTNIPSIGISQTQSNQEKNQ